MTTVGAYHRSAAVPRHAQAHRPRVSLDSTPNPFHVALVTTQWTGLKGWLREKGAYSQIPALPTTVCDLGEAT